ncbi:MAG: hypothetical protein K0S34_164 [Bacillales bacterium]|jgi:hypothetical protein|nr:hypothetical protein [Bacillales bacterium]
MQLDELISKINQSVEELDFVTTRIYIEENVQILNENKNLLKKNARDLLEFITKRLDSGKEPFKRQELAVFNALNNYALKFDLRGLKVCVKDNAKLLLRDDVIYYLNSDAKILLEGMGVIKGDQIIKS